MIGCDIVKISRFTKNLEKWKNRILTLDEQLEFEKRKNKLSYIAGRWAAKEAIYKINKEWLSLSILNDPTGQTYVKGRPEIKISISHEDKYCIAVAMII
jgi:holo-[acyl-carrier protein] synthase